MENGYYYIDIIILLLAFLYLSRIKNPEQTKSLQPGEFGKILGIDRIPEMKCLRSKIKEISSQKKAVEWNKTLVQHWNYKDDDNHFFYIDGHIQVYYGYKGQLGKKHVSRQKLCLPGMQEFWVNNKEGLPYFYVTGEVNEKLQEIISSQIIEKLLTDLPPKYNQEELENDAKIPLFTIVFDREAYSPKFFGELWENHRVAVITYRKNVKEEWAETDFKEHKIIIEGQEIKMMLAEKEIELNGIKMREIRRKTKSSHQTSIITTNGKLNIEQVATYMFARWSQENFFKYMRQDYDFDRMIQYAVEQVNEDFTVVNPEYNKVNNELKLIRQKISRKLAALYKLEHKNVKENLDKTPKNNVRQVSIATELEEYRENEKDLIDKRSELPYRIKIKDMSDELKYNKLHTESKHVQNIIKMICYRAETSMANSLSPYYKRSIHEKRMLAKSIMKANVNIIPDYKNNTLTVELYSLSRPRDNDAAKKLCEILNKQKCKFPKTDLVMVYKMAT